MKILSTTILLSLLFVGRAQGQNDKSVKIQVIESSSDEQDHNVPARLACTQSLGCFARGSETVATYTVKIQAKIVSSGDLVTLTCELRKKGDEKRCGRLLPNVYTAEPKGNNQVTVYAWANPLFKGDMSKANKLVFRVGAAQ